MCYSGRCIWEDFMGDCRFPMNKEVRDKYPFPLCSMTVESKEEQELLDEQYEDIRNILNGIRNKSE